MPGFRSLGDEEEVEFECKVSDKGLEATLVTGPQSQDCKGSHRRPMSKKRFRKIRCYNCGEFANHIAAKCNMGPQPKRCHHCKSADHLIADCPLREEKKSIKNGSGDGSGGGDGSSANGNDDPDNLIRVITSSVTGDDNNSNTTSNKDDDNSSSSNEDFEEEDCGKGITIRDHQNGQN